MIYCVVTNPALDVFYRIKELQSGKSITSSEFESYPSGKGINIAKVIQSLSEEVTVLSIIPENDKPRFSNFLHDRGIPSHFYTIEGNASINTTITEEASDNVTYISNGEYQLSPRIQDEFQCFLEEHMSPGDVWTLSGGLPQGFDVDTYAKIIKRCKAKGIAVMLDSSGIALSMGIRAKPAMVKPNLEELESFFGEPIEGVHHIALKGKRLLDMGINYAFISLGADGMIAVHENDCLLCSPPFVDPVDSVGSGDALVAGFLVGQLRNFSFIESCRMGIACGTSNAMHAGPGVIDNDEIWSLMEEVRIESV